MHLSFCTVPLYNGSYKQFIRASGISRGKTWNVSESFRFSAFSYVNFDVEYDPQSSWNHIWRWLYEIYIFMILTLPKTQKWFMIKLLYYVDQWRFFICVFVTNAVMKTMYTNTMGWQQWLNVKERYIKTTFWSIIKGVGQAFKGRCKGISNIKRPREQNSNTSLDLR